MDWTHTGDLVRNGDVWSTPDWRPSSEDYRKIADACLDRHEQSRSIGVARKGVRIRLYTVERRYEDVNSMHFEGTGELFIPGMMNLTEWQREVVFSTEGQDTFSTDDIAKFLFPYNYYRGTIQRAPDNHYSNTEEAWTDDETHPNFDAWEEINMTYRARDLTQTQFQRLRKLGIIEDGGYNAWKINASALKAVSTKDK